MPKHMLPFLCLLALFILSNSSLCQPNKDIDKLISGKASFSISNLPSSTSQTYNISFPIKYDTNSNLQYAFALNNMQALTNNISYFDLVLLKTFQSHLVLNFIYQPNKWTLVTYNYWISFRNDMELALQSFISDQIGPTNNSYLITNILRINTAKDTAKYAAMVFLNGIRYNTNNQTNINHHLSFTILSQYISYNNLMIQFTCFEALPVYSLTLSYIVYIPEQMQFVSYGGVINHINFNSSHQNSLEYILPYSNFYILYGISAIVTDNTNSTFSFQSSIDMSYSLQYSVKASQILKAIEISYIIFGQIPSNLCQKNTNCSSTNKKFIHNTECIQICPANSKIITYFDGAQQCRQCPQNSFFSQSTNQCECLNGYKLDQNNHCVPRTQNLSNLVTDNFSIPLTNQSTFFTPSQQCLKLIKLQQNNKNIYATLQASPQILSSPNSLDNNFIKILTDTSQPPTSSYCSIDTQNPQQYNCLLLFATGLPQKQFNLAFQCSIPQGTTSKICSLVILHLPNNIIS